MGGDLLAPIFGPYQSDWTPTANWLTLTTVVLRP